jgi:hypothetical protein
MIELTRELLAKLPMSLRIEIEENAQRKDLSQSELAAVQELLIKELSKHKAPGSRTDLKPTSARKQAVVRATTLIGKLFNEGHDKVEKRLAIAKAAKVEPGKFGKLKEDMDRTGRVIARSRGLSHAPGGRYPPGSTFATLIRPGPTRFEKKIRRAAGFTLIHQCRSRKFAR